MAFFLRNKNLMQFFARSNASNHSLNGPVADQRRGNINHASRWDAGDVSFTEVSLFVGGEDRIHCLIKTEQESGHIRSRNCQRAAIANLVVKKRNHRTA